MNYCRTVERNGVFIRITFENKKEAMQYSSLELEKMAEKMIKQMKKAKPLEENIPF
jgi:hypothetical protein